jgi:hypothetical protein
LTKLDLNDSIRFMKSRYQLAAMAIVLGGFAATAPAQVIFNQNFDGGYSGAFGTSQYFGGAPTNYANAAIVSGGNPNGAWRENMTTTTWGDYYAGQLQLMTVSGNTDPDASHYVLSFDAMGSRAANIQLGLQSWQNNYFGGSQLINTTLNDPLAAANTWQTFTVNLGTISGANPTGATWQFNFQVNSWEWGGPENANTLTIDNVVLSQIPEPATALLAGLAAAALWLFRRK